MAYDELVTIRVVQIFCIRKVITGCAEKVYVCLYILSAKFGISKLKIFPMCILSEPSEKQKGTFFGFFTIGKLKPI